MSIRPTYPLLAVFVFAISSLSCGESGPQGVSQPDEKPGWVVTSNDLFGDVPGWSSCNDLGVDRYGDVYVTGSITGMFNPEPGKGAVERASSSGGSGGAFLLKVDSQGEIVWAVTWGAKGRGSGKMLDLDGDGNVYVISSIGGTADLDPGPGVLIRDLTRSGDCLSKFNDRGQLIWAVTWESGDNFGELEMKDFDVDDSGNVVIGGGVPGYYFDFDPSPAVDKRETPGWRDGFVSKFDSSGRYQWTNLILGDGYLCQNVCYAVCVDQCGDVYATGSLNTPMVDVDVPEGAPTSFLNKYSPHGDLLWSNYSHLGLALAVGSDNSLYVDEGVSLTRLDPEGYQLWSLTMPALNLRKSRGIVLGPFDDIIIFGTFTGLVDFDPGRGKEFRKSLASSYMTDSFVSELDASGGFRWVDTWDTQGISDVAVDYLGNAYVVGDFKNTVDFDPGSGIEQRTTTAGSEAFLVRLNQNGLW